VKPIKLTAEEHAAGVLAFVTTVCGGMWMYFAWLCVVQGESTLIVTSLFGVYTLLATTAVLGFHLKHVENKRTGFYDRLTNEED
jgi:hypothetical protein